MPLESLENGHSSFPSARGSRRRASSPRRSDVLAPRGASSAFSSASGSRRSLTTRSTSVQTDLDEQSSSSARSHAQRDAETQQILETAASREHRRRLSLHAKRRPTQRAQLLQSALTGRPLRGRPGYFTEGHVADAERRDVNAEPAPYWVPRAADELCYKVMESEWQREALEKERRAPYFEHHTGRSRRALDLLRRLHLPRDAEDPATTTPGILDIDPDYYSIVEGRPENAGTLGRLDLRQYLSDIRQVLLTKLLIGYAEDHALLVDEQYTQELKVITHILNQHQKHVKTFEMFLAEDHKKSMDVLQKADKMTTETNRMDTEVKSLNRALDRLRNEVYVLEENWNTVRGFQRFLYRASPRAWRMQHDYEYMKHMNERGSLTSMEDVGSFLVAREERSDMTLNELIAVFNEEVDNRPPPQLYFKTPKDLLDVFDNIAHINMDMMVHSEQVRKPLDELFDTLQDAQKRMKADTERMRLALKEQKRSINWELQRGAELEQEARRLLEDVFKDLVINDEVIKTFVCVEDAFEVAVALNDNNLSVVEMMRDIERKYEMLTDELDRVPPTVVSAVEQEVYMDEKVGMMRAHVAALQMDQIRRMEDRMHKAILNPPPSGRRMLVFRSPPFVRFVKRFKTEAQLTKEERDMLLHLTEWCPERDDPEPYLRELRDTGMLE